MPFGAFAPAAGGRPLKKNILTGLAALTLLDVSAELACAQNWNGPYAGVHVGYSTGTADLTASGLNFFAPRDLGKNFTSPARSENYNPEGPLGGGHIGYNFLVQPNWLVGIEADLTAASASETVAATFLSTDGVAVRTSKVHLGTQGTVRGRVGYAAGPWLVYATGGAAFVRFKWSETIVIQPPPLTTFTAGATKTLSGYAVGGGAERIVNSNLSVRVQYLYLDFGSETVPLAATSQPGQVSNISAHQVTVGGSLRF
jgi:outer membrane immunogenic protein